MRSDAAATLTRYFGTITQFTPLDADTERALATRWLEHRDRAARRTLIETHLKFVVRIAFGYRRYRFAMDELVAEGNLGLLEAVDRFDPERGVRFVTYAAFWIRAFILSYVQRHWSLVRVPGSSRRSSLFFKLARARGRLLTAFGHVASAEEIELALMKQFNASRASIEEATARLEQRDVSLDAPVSDDSPGSLLQTLDDQGEACDEQLERIERETRVREVVETIAPELSSREAFILEHRLLCDEPLTLHAISAHFGVSRERVRQIEHGLKERLRIRLAPLDPERQAA
jgi:RNA polymerase sigma-32 factor